jgi:hypothetical protein
MDTWERKSPSIYEPLPKSVAGEDPKANGFNLTEAEAPPLVTENEAPPLVTENLSLPRNIRSQPIKVIMISKTASRRQMPR